MIRNEIWEALSLTYPYFKEKKWYLLLHQALFPLDYVKHHIKSLQKGSEADQYVVQKLTWSGVYLKSTLSSAILMKVLKLVLLT